MNVCDDCPIRLFNDKGYNLNGVGNPHYGNCIILPNVDYTAYKKSNLNFSSQIDVINECLVSSTGKLDILNNVYVVPMIRCREVPACNANIDIYKRCLYYLKQDVIKYNFKHILVLGSAVRAFFDIDIESNLDNIFVSPNKRIYNVNYSPLIKYIDEDLFLLFKQYLIKWYNSVIKGNYFIYKIKRLT